MDELLQNMYQERIMDHYRNPRNSKFLDCKVSCVGEGANPTCGDRLSLAFVFGDDGKISDVSELSQGCAISVASASLLSEYLIGKNLEEIKMIDEDVVREMIGVPISANRMRCAMLPLATLKQAIKNIV